MQDIFLVAQTSADHQLQHYAAWAVSFLRYSLVSREDKNGDNGVPADGSSSQVTSHTFSDDSVVMKLSLWLMNLGYPNRDVINFFQPFFLLCLPSRNIESLQI